MRLHLPILVTQLNMINLALSLAHLVRLIEVGLLLPPVLTSIWSFISEYLRIYGCLSDGAVPNNF